MNFRLNKQIGKHKRKLKIAYMLKTTTDGCALIILSGNSFAKYAGFIQSTTVSMTWDMNCLCLYNNCSFVHIIKIVESFSLWIIPCLTFNKQNDVYNWSRFKKNQVNQNKNYVFWCYTTTTTTNKTLTRAAKGIARATTRNHTLYEYVMKTDDYKEEEEEEES